MTGPQSSPYTGGRGFRSRQWGGSGGGMWDRINAGIAGFGESFGYHTAQGHGYQPGAPSANLRSVAQQMGTAGKGSSKSGGGKSSKKGGDDVRDPKVPKTWGDRPSQNWAGTLGQPSASNSMLSGGLGATGDWRQINNRKLDTSTSAFGAMLDKGIRKGGITGLNAMQYYDGSTNDPVSPTNPMAGAPSVAGGRDPYGDIGMENSMGRSVVSASGNPIGVSTWPAAARQDYAGTDIDNQQPMPWSRNPSSGGVSFT